MSENGMKLSPGTGPGWRDSLSPDTLEAELPI